MTANYPAWSASYSNEAFDRAQALAADLTQADRDAGRSAPQYGYSSANFITARQIVDDASVWSAKSQSTRKAL